jgi:hypothetical protein
VKKSSDLVAGFVLATALVACRAAPSAGPPPAAGAGPSAGASEVRVVLLWEAPVDLDLYVTDPAQESVYFANNPSGSGGRLEKDSTCDAPGGVRREVVRWPSAAPGRYRVGVDFMDRCGTDAREIGYRLVVDAGGRRQEKTGKVAWLDRFTYRAFEFDLGKGSREESAGK